MRVVFHSVICDDRVCMCGATDQLERGERRRMPEVAEPHIRLVALVDDQRVHDHRWARTGGSCAGGMDAEPDRCCLRARDSRSRWMRLICGSRNVARRVYSKGGGDSRLSSVCVGHMRQKAGGDECA